MQLQHYQINEVSIKIIMEYNRGSPTVEREPFGGT